MARPWRRLRKWRPLTEPGGGPATVIPAQAGISRSADSNEIVFSVPFWIPAYAGMTVTGCDNLGKRWQQPVAINPPPR